MARPDLLQVSTVSRSGKHSPIQLRGAAYLTVTKAFNAPSCQIAVQVQHSSGVGSFKRTHEQDAALINVTFEDGFTWSGSFEDLRTVIVLGNPNK